jgi:hypothetical protein
VGELVTTVTMPAEQIDAGGWVPAKVISDLLATVLATAM